MKTQIQKSIFFYLLTSFFFLLKAEAQIVYTDVNPDSISSSSYNLDLNNDGVNDFTLRKSNLLQVYVHCTPCHSTTYVTPSIISIQPLGSNAIGLNGGNSNLNSSTLIDSTGLSWQDT